MKFPNFSVYKGKEKEGSFTDCIAENKFFLILEMADGITLAQGKELSQKIKTDLSLQVIDNLTSLDQFVSGIITRHNLPSSLSLAIGYVKEGLLYLKTVGEGAIFLKRGVNFAKILDKDKSASGYIQRADTYIFTVKKILNVLGSENELNNALGIGDAASSTEKLSTILNEKDVSGLAAVVLSYHEEKIEERAVPDEPVVFEKKSFFDKIKEKQSSLLANYNEFSEKTGKRKIFTFSAVILILLILTWSVVLGYKRRSIAEANKKIELVRVTVDKNLAEAEQLAFLNLPKAMVLITDSKNEVKKLKEDLGTENKEVLKIENSIKNFESKIVKKEERNYDEFYDLTLDNKNAKGSILYLDGDSLSVADSDKGTIYTLSLSKKSLDKNSSPQLKNALYIASYQDYKVFFVEGGDIFKVSSDDKTTKVISSDSDWGKIAGMWIFNGNLYLLDSVKGDIYKYLVTEGGYSEKSSYFGGAAGSIKEANSIAIDSSVYIGFDNGVSKYTSGGKDEFSTSWPEKNVNLTKIYTNEEAEKVYGWSKDKGVIYVLSKNGTYDRQINSSVLSKITDFVVYEESAYVLVGEKIYRIDLN